MTWRVDEVRLYRWTTFDECTVLLTIGWWIESVDERYGTILMSCQESLGPCSWIKESSWAAQPF
jgi:hypothetical protein